MENEVSQRTQEQMKKHFEYENIPVEDGTPISLETIRTCTRYIEQSVKKGRIYVHCQRRISRSPAILMCYFISQGNSGKIAHNLIKTKRKRVWINHAILLSIYEFEKSVSKDMNPSIRVEHSAYEEIINQGYRKLGRFIRYVLTHENENYRIAKDYEGFTERDDLVLVLKKRFEFRKWVTSETIHEMESRIGRKMFETSKGRIRVISNNM